MSIICRLFGYISVIAAAMVGFTYFVKGAASGSVNGGSSALSDGALAVLESIPVVAGLVLVGAVFVALGKYLRSPHARPRRY